MAQPPRNVRIVGLLRREHLDRDVAARHTTGVPPCHSRSRYHPPVRRPLSGRTALKKSSRDLTDQVDRIEQFAHSEQARLSRRRSTLRERTQRPVVSLDVDRFPAAEPSLRRGAGDDE